MHRFIVAGVVALPSVVVGQPVTSAPLAEESTNSAQPDVAAAPGKSAAPVPSVEQIAEWAAALDDDRYATRVEAMRRLTEAGAAALEPTAKVASSGSPEGAMRALRVLEALYRQSFDMTDPEADKIEQALERLADLPHQAVASRAADLLDWNIDLREERALANIRRLGGVLRYESDRGMNVPAATARFGQMKSVILTADWKGGDEGLRFVKRLTRLQSIYRVPGDHVSEKGIRELQAALPDMRVEVRGPTFLGIKAQPELGNGGMVWRVDEVEQGSSAERGGIQVGDIVVRFAGKDVPDFSVLIERIKETKLDEEVEVVVQRGGGLTTLKIVMQGWKNLDEPARDQRAK